MYLFRGIVGKGVSFVEGALKRRPTVSDLFKSYERTILQTAISTFGLDGLSSYQHGGDVDTVHTVRQIGKDSQMTYKNENNKKAYNNRGIYDSKEYHSHADYRAANRNISISKKEGTLFDGYTGKRIARNGKVDQDHVVSAYEIHNDPGRVLAEVDGASLANKSENLVGTDPSINRSKKALTVDEYVEGRGKNLNKRTKSNRRRKDKIARNAINNDIHTTYYTSQKFWKDTGTAALKAGSTMAIRQGLGFFLVEIWFGIKEKCVDCWSEVNSLKAFRIKLVEGIKLGFSNAKAKLKELWNHIKNGALGGIISVLVTTLINTFTSTLKSVARLIMQLGKTVVEAFRILVFNPEKLSWEDRIEALIKCIITGGSIALGSVVTAALDAQLVGVPFGDLIGTFLGGLVSGITMATGFYLIDRYEVGSWLNKVFEDPCFEYLKQVGANIEKTTKLISDMVERMVHYDWAACEMALQKYKTSTGKVRADVSLEIARACGVKEDKLVKSIEELDEIFG